jgi:NADPH:quinone reductase-like Zn-dependent oxidoreductase
LCDGALTSLNFLKEIAQIKPGHKILINGAAGSLGTAAIQLARYFSAEVTGVCSTKNVGLVRSLGAHHVIDYTKEDFTQSGVKYDVIYDTIGKSSFGKCKKVMTENGQYISPVLKFSLLIQMMWTSLFGKQKAKFAASGLKKRSRAQILNGRASPNHPGRQIKINLLIASFLSKKRPRHTDTFQPLIKKGM